MVACGAVMGKGRKLVKVGGFLHADGEGEEAGAVGVVEEGVDEAGLGELKVEAERSHQKFRRVVQTVARGAIPEARVPGETIHVQPCLKGIHPRCDVMPLPVGNEPGIHPAAPVPEEVRAVAEVPGPQLAVEEKHVPAIERAWNATLRNRFGGNLQ